MILEVVIDLTEKRSDEWRDHVILRNARDRRAVVVVVDRILFILIHILADAMASRVAVSSLRAAGKLLPTSFISSVLTPFQ